MKSMLALALCTLTGCVYIIPDYAHRPKGMKPNEVEYRTWTSSGRINKQTGSCTFTIFALVTRERLTRLRVNGIEQELGWSWSWEAKVPEGNHASGMFVEFIDARTSKILATHDIWTRCPYRNEVIYD
jgi:hypothetical protein